MTIRTCFIANTIPDVVSPWMWGIEEGLFRPFLSQRLVLGERFKPEIMEGFRLLADPDLSWDPWATEGKQGFISYTVSMKAKVKLLSRV